MTYYYYWNNNPDARNDSVTTDYNSSVVINVLANDYDKDCDKLCVVSATDPDHGSVTVNSDGTVTFTPDAGFSGTTCFTYKISDGKGGYDTATVTVCVNEPESDGIVSGTAGDDLIDYDYTGDPDGDRIDHNDAILPGESGNDDIVKAGAGNDTVLAGAGNDEVHGQDGNDSLDGGAGNDYLSGGAGDDTLHGGAGNDTYEGGSGLDMIDYSDSAAGVTVNLDTGALSGGDAAGDSIAGGVDGVIGSDYNDSLVGFDHQGTDPADTYTNVFYGNAGDDTIAGGGADDSLYGGSNDDSIEGGSGDDLIVGDGADTNPTETEELTLDWGKFAAAGCAISNGASVDLGGVKATFGFQVQDSGATATVTNEVQYVEAGDGLSGSTGLKLYGCGGEGGIDNTSTTTINFASTDADNADAVQNVSFRINDIDQGYSGDYHRDIVTIRAYDADGNEVPVTITSEGGVTVSGNTATGQAVDNGTNGQTPTAESGSVLVEVQGPVAKIVIDYDNGGNTDQAIYVTDLNLETVSAVDAVEGDDTLLGGDGDDTIFGNGGDDSIIGGAGNDVIDGGADRDVIAAGAGDVVDGGADGDDWDTLDLTGQGAYRVINTTTDSNGNGLDGTVEFLDTDGVVTGSLSFTEIEEIRGDGINLAPHAVDDTATVLEDDSVTITVLGNDSDPDGDTLTVTSASSPDGTVTINADGTLTFEPNENFNGDTTITYTVDDGRGGTDTATVNVSVTPVNDDPIANDDTATTDFGTTVTVDLIGNDTDIDGDTLTVTSATSADGTVTINADGSIDFTPNDGFEGVAEVTYTVSDGNGGFDTATAYITVNEAPLDGIVEGTAGDDLIDFAYTGDPEGDMIDAGDALLPGEVGDDDIVLAGDGDDTVRAGEGNDEVFGEAGDDSLLGQAGDDLLDGGAGNDVLDGGAGADTLLGGEGNDTLRGGEGGDSLDGGAGEDSLVGGTEDDVLLGGADDDTLQGAAGNDTLDGGTGDDTLNGGSGDDSLLGGDGRDSLNGSDGNDTLDGGEGNDQLLGGSGDDSLIGDEGDDLLDGGNGNDTLLGGAGNDTFDGGNGNDLAEGGEGDDYIDTSADASLPDLAYPGLWTADANPNDDLDTVYGGAGNDTIITGDDRDYIEGGDGNDVINAGVDEDTVLGGAGDDLITAGEGDDLIDAGEGNDTIYGGLGPSYPDVINVPDATDLVQDNGMDTIHAGAGDDVVYGEDDDDLIYGDAGNDYLDGGIDEDTIEGGAGNDTVIGGQGADVLSGGDDRDSFTVATAEAGIGDQIDGGEGGDDYDVLDLTGAGPVNILYDATNPENGTVEFLDSDGNVVGTLDFVNIENVITDQGDGIVEGTDGGDLIDINYTGDPEGDRVDNNDALIPGDAPNDDRIEAGAGDDTVYAGVGDDTVEAGDGDDEVYGQDGDDSLIGGAGDDTLNGGAGNDTLEGGAGNDLAEGGDGDDLIDTTDGTYAPDRGYPGLFPGDTDPNNDLDTVYGGAGNDTIVTGDDRDYIDAGTGNDSIDAGCDDDTVLGGDGNDYIVGAEGSDLIDGGTGDDTIYAGLAPGYPDSLNIPDATDLVPDNGMDTVHGGDGNDVIYGADDDDLLFGDNGDDYIDGGIDEDTIFGGEGNDTLLGGDGADSIDGGAASDTIDGGAGDDTLLGGEGDDSITGGEGADELTGGQGQDLLDGGAGNDTLSGGVGVDTLLGGLNSDSFVIGSADEGNNDVIDGGEDPDNSDWDVLDLSAIGKDNLSINYTSADKEDGIVTFLDNNGNAVGSLTFSNIENVIPCFTPGTLVATPKGEKLVEDLKVGDKVITRDNGIQELRWIGRRDLNLAELTAAPHLKPVLIKAGSLGQGLPERDMLVSPNHRMLVANERTALYFEEHEVLVAAKHLVDNKGVKVAESLGTSYLHFMFDRHEVVLANGAWTESFQPGDQTLGGMGNAQRNEIFELFPELKTAQGVENYGAARKTLKRHEAALLKRG